MPAAEEYFEYNYLRHHAVVNAQATYGIVRLELVIPPVPVREKPYYL